VVLLPFSKSLLLPVQFDLIQHTSAVCEESDVLGLISYIVYAIEIISYEGTCAQWRLNGQMEERDKALCSLKGEGLKRKYYYTNISSTGIVHSKGFRMLLLCVQKDSGY
jgi:hypothetical protein